jgi:hypothetical protein
MGVTPAGDRVVDLFSEDIRLSAPGSAPNERRARSMSRIS